MCENEVKRLKDLIEQAPENMMLRVALVRRLISMKEDTEALSLALAMDLSIVRAASDRRILADLFRRAGLSDHAQRLDDDEHTMLDEEPAFERPNSVVGAPDDPPPRGRKVKLRVVGGTDAPKK